ncbi:MAG: APC family permease [Acidobacteriota bacterium]|jgi:APA family basic amino acid/polyamine antiporter|nr:APC family permease [Acidobacteriota bacterium]
MRDETSGAMRDAMAGGGAHPHPPGTPASTRDLKRVLGFGSLMGIAVGQIVGAGIMSLMGVAIAMTGRSAAFSFMVAAALVVVTSLPQVIVCGTIRLRGGGYTQGVLLGGRIYGGVTMILGFLMNLSLAMYALSFADYFAHFAPGAPPRLTAVAILTLFFLLNCVGIDWTARIQNIIVVAMCAGLGLLAAFGIGEVRWDGFFGEGFMLGGFLALFQAGTLLTSATAGATAVVNLGAEAKNPTRDIPLVIIVATSAVALLYGFIGFVAAGVLPLGEVAGKPLTGVAEAVLPKPLFVFFMVAGAMGALATTLNAQFSAVTKPMLQASIDGWLPKGLGRISRFKTPVAWLAILYAVGMVPILTGLDIGEVAGMVIAVSSVVGVAGNLLLVRLPKVVPDQWRKSRCRIPAWALWAVALLSSLTSLAQFFLIAPSLTPNLLALNLAAAAAVVGYCWWRVRSGKVEMEVSHEDG